MSICLPSLQGVRPSHSPRTYQPLTAFTNTKVPHFLLLFGGIKAHAFRMHSSLRWAPNLYLYHVCYNLAKKCPRFLTISLLSITKYCSEVIAQEFWPYFSYRFLLWISLAWKSIDRTINCFPLSRHYSVSYDVTVSCLWAKYLKVFRCLKMQVMWIFQST